MAKSQIKNKVNNKKTTMADTKVKSKKSVKVIKKLRSQATKEVSTPSISEIKEVKSNKFGFILKLVLIAVLGTIVYLLAVKYRSMFLVGTVNNSPITRWEVNSKMAEKYAKQTMDEIVNERLLESELKKSKIEVTDAEVATEMEKLIAQYGGEEAFQAAITQFGLTPEKAKDSIKQSLGFKKLVEKNYTIEITDESVKAYFDENATVFKDKKFEDVSAEIKDNLYQQEVYTKSQEWFTNVRKEAKIVSFI